MLSLGALLFIVALLLTLVSFAAGVWLAVLGFKRHVLWGLGILFVPFVAIVYAVKFWDEARRPFLASVASGIVSTVLFGVALSVGILGAARTQAHPMEANIKPAVERTAPPAPPAPTTEPSGTPEAAPVPAPEPALPANAATIAEPKPAARRAALPYDPSDVDDRGFAPLPVRSASYGVGRNIRLVTRDGQEHVGDLLSASNGTLQVRVSLGAGTVTIDFREAEVGALFVKADPKEGGPS